MRAGSSRQQSSVIRSIEFLCRILSSLFVASVLSPYFSSAAAFPCSEATNVASAANGATAIASSSYAGFAANGAVNGDRKGLFVWQDGYWSAASAGPAWLEVQFNGNKTISEIDVFTTQDNYNAPVEPTEAMTFSTYGVTGFEVQYWTGSAWATITGAVIAGNNKVWRKFSFTPLSTTKIRVLTSASPDGFGRLTEVEAWTGPSPSPRFNLALASSGAVATASNSYNAGYGPGGTNNGDRKSLNWTNGGGWNDSGPPFPDYLEIDFGAMKTVSEVDVFTLQDNYASPAEPTESMTFTLWGLTAFELEHWTGSGWAAIPGTTVTGNNKVWRRLTFAPIDTSKVRVKTTGSVDGYSRITEVEVYGPASPCASVARLDPLNQTGAGENPLSRNFNWSLPLVHLPGRTGMDLGLTLSYNSLVWTRSGNHISFDDDRGSPAPGFRLGFPVIQPLYYNAEVGKFAFLLIGTDGSRTELRQVGTSSLYEAADSSHLLLDAGTMVLRATDGTQLSYTAHANEYNCTQIKDRNGNYITINYTALGRIDTIIDTLARSIKFNYDSSGRLTSITQIWNQSSPSQVTHYWAVFDYSTTTIQTNFSGLIVSGPPNGSTIKTLAQVTLADGARYDFSYTSWGQVWKVSSFAADNHLLNYRAYNLPQTADPQTPYSDCPRFTERRDWAQYWNGDTDDVPASNEEAVTAFAAPVADTWTMPDGAQQTGTRAQVTTPDGTSSKIYYIGTAGAASGWRRGLPALVETISGGTWQRQVMTTWTQDNTSVSYSLNPRIAETNVYDPAGNRARVQLTYQQVTFANGTSCQLPRDVYEYAANATTILRSTRTDYNSNTAYTDRRIIGLVSEKQLYEGDVNSGGVLKSKVGFFYDNENGANSIQGTDAPVQHDNTNYTASFVTGRGNLSSVRRYNVDNLTQYTTTRSKYNTAGAIVSAKDASDHESLISYADSFSDGNNSRNTLAYPTTLTDPDGYTATAKHHFDFGAMTYKRTPQPNTTQNLPGPEQVSTYDIIGRLQQVTNQVNGAYKRYVYPNSMTRVETYGTIQEGLGEADSFTFTDGAGRVIANATEHPGSIGGYSGQKFVYDVMGRVIKTSNPTETNASGAPTQWVATGDDAAAGWVYTQQTYDWKGRPLVTTNQDGTTKTASYAGCGCAGGEVVTLTDEGTIDAGVAKRRQQKIYTDVLGRTYKTEVLNWEGGSVYSTTVTSFNARDQVMQIKEYAGAEGIGTYQETAMTYDGYGRLKSRHVPEQTAGAVTTWAYNADDTIQKVTDGREASSTFTYNSRHSISGITYAAPTGVTLPPAVSYLYDAAGNRTAMTDGSGETTYQYDQLSRMSSETRVINGLIGSQSIIYTYGLAGQLKSLTDPQGRTVNYDYDVAGQLTNVTGLGYTNTSQFANDFKYRAWGPARHYNIGFNWWNGTTSLTPMELSYNNRLQLTDFTLAHPNPAAGPIYDSNYQYYADGRVRFIEDERAWSIQEGWPPTENMHHFDRAYRYDHAGRLVEGLTGSEARGGATADGPYRESYQYDVWNNLNQRTNRIWSKPLDSFSHTYVNNRNQIWQYDADGNDTSEATFNARGLRSTFSTYLFLGLGSEGNFLWYSAQAQATYDGNGSLVKEEDVVGATTCMRLYYIRSSVLGGQVIMMVKDEPCNGAGVVTRITSIYAHGGRIATSKDGNVSFEHSETLTGRRGGVEIDPLGQEVGAYDPGPTEPGGVGQYQEPHEFGNVEDPGRGCTMDGITIDCNTAMRFVSTGAAFQCQNNDCFRRWATVDIKYGSGRVESYAGWIGPNVLPDGFSRSWHGGAAFNAALWFRYTDTAGFEGRVKAGIVAALLSTSLDSGGGFLGSSFLLPQNPAPTPQTTPSSAHQVDTCRSLMANPQQWQSYINDVGFEGVGNVAMDPPYKIDTGTQSSGNFLNALKDAGWWWPSGRPNLNPEHAGGVNLQREVQAGKWLHITVFPGQTKVTTRFLGIKTGTKIVDDWSKPPRDIQLHCERLWLQPSSFEHLKDFLLY